MLDTTLTVITCVSFIVSQFCKFYAISSNFITMATQLSLPSTFLYLLGTMGRRNCQLCPRRKNQNQNYSPGLHRFVLMRSSFSIKHMLEFFTVSFGSGRSLRKASSVCSSSLNLSRALKLHLQADLSALSLSL